MARTRGLFQNNASPLRQWEVLGSTHQVGLNFAECDPRAWVCMCGDRQIRSSVLTHLHYESTLLQAPLLYGRTQPPPSALRMRERWTLRRFSEPRYCCTHGLYQPVDHIDKLIVTHLVLFPSGTRRCFSELTHFHVLLLMSSYLCLGLSRGLLL